MDIQTQLVERRPIDNHEKHYNVHVSHFRNGYCCHDGNGHRHPHYEVHWVPGDCATLICDMQKFKVQGGSLVFIAPGQVHTWLTNDTHYLSAFSFTPELFTLHGQDFGVLLRQLPFHRTEGLPYVTINADTIPLINQLFETAQNRQTQDNGERLLLAYLTLILAEAQRHYEPTGAALGYSAAARLSQEFWLLVEAHYLERWQVGQYADALGVTANYLIETIRQAQGITPGRIIQDRLLLEAKRLLVHTRLTIAEIAELLSFTTISYFGRWFKNLTDCSPTQYRDQHIHLYDR